MKPNDKLTQETINLLGKYSEEVTSENLSNASKEISTISTDEEILIDDIIKQHNINVSEAAEKQKIFLREKLTKTISGIIWVQIIFFNIIVIGIVGAVVLDVPIFKVMDDEKIVSLLFDFLKYYIGATILELLGMLVFVLHYAFSETSKFTELLKRLKDIKNKKQ